jgi:hypothetical protein
MTTLIAWVGADQRGPASIRLAADSRISWSLPNGSAQKTWDFGKKLFASHNDPDIVGYCGDVLFPTQTLGQIFELIDRRVFFPTGATPEEKLRLIVEALERSSAHYPQSETREFTLLYGTRTSEGMSGKFNLYEVDYAGGKNVSTKKIPIPQKSGILARLGSGRDPFKKHLDRWEKSDVGGTSRAVFSSFADSLKSGDGLKSGGPPQLTGLFREGPARAFGIVWNECRFWEGWRSVTPRRTQRSNGITSNSKFVIPAH